MLRPLAFALLVAAAASAAMAAAPSDKEVSPVIVRPPPKGAPHADVTVPVTPEAVDRQNVAIWPAAARDAGISGYATLSCLVDVHGLAEDCKVIFEAPARQGFGAAALALRPTFKLTPKTGPDGPQDATMNIAVQFSMPETRSNLADLQKRSAGMETLPPEGAGAAGRGSGSQAADARDLVIFDNPVQMRKITMMDSRAWAQAPGFDDVAAAYPATGGGVEGYAVAHCRVQKTGVLEHCVAAKEFPQGRGFGKAALGLTAKFRVATAALAAAPSGAPIEIDVPVRFPAAADARDRIVHSPVWVAGSDPISLIARFPAGVVRRPTTPGALVTCVVGPDGTLTGCKVELTSPDGIDFDDAAVAMASQLRMAPWSAEAGPVLGGVVRINIKPSMVESAQR
jgi:TonB family protein